MSTFTLSGYDSHGKAVLVVTTTTFILASVFVLARLVSRFAVLRSRTLDDWFMIVAWVCFWSGHEERFD